MILKYSMFLNSSGVGQHFRRLRRGFVVDNYAIYNVMPFTIAIADVRKQCICYHYLHLKVIDA